MMFAFTPHPNDGKSWDAEQLDTLHELISLGTQEAVRRKAQMLDRRDPRIPA